MSREMGIIQGDTFGDFVSSVQKVGNCFRADYGLLCLMKEQMERGRKPTRTLAVDENTILIDGRRAEEVPRQDAIPKRKRHKRVMPTAELKASVAQLAERNPGLSNNEIEKLLGLRPGYISDQPDLRNIIKQARVYRRPVSVEGVGR
ncbi:MAG: hypothetical protein Q4D98_13795 [Planctomycetia bacterium]|nr:hypothetical protein [Planctomycetia bacterium]